MRNWVVGLMMLFVTLSGCSGDSGDEPKEGGALLDDAGQSSTTTTTSTSTSTTGTGTSQPSDDPAPNMAPAATLNVTTTTGFAPLNLTFVLGGSDADGDALSWTFDADGDGAAEAQGQELPATVHFLYVNPGTFNATLTVDDGAATGNATQAITVEKAVPEAVAEVFYIHDDGSATWLDHTPAAEREAGHGLANVLALGYAKDYSSTEPTVATHAAGTTVEVRIQAFPLAPHPLVTIETSLTLDGVIIGSGSDTQTAVAVALVTTPCTEWVATFATTQEIPVGSSLGLSVAGDNILPMAGCYPGGESGPRITIG